MNVLMKTTFDIRNEEMHKLFESGVRCKTLQKLYGLTESGVKQALSCYRKKHGLIKVNGNRKRIYCGKF